MLAAGMQETDLMAVVGWKSREMVSRSPTGHADGTGIRNAGDCIQDVTARQRAASLPQQRAGARAIPALQHHGARRGEPRMTRGVGSDGG
jgi:hypothetical protein